MTKAEKLLLKFPPTKFILGKTKKISLPGFEGMPLYDVVAFFRQQIIKIGFATRAAAISFNIMMALPAGLIFLGTMVPYIPKAIHFERELLKALADIMKNEKAYRLMADIIHDFFRTQRTGLLSFSFVAAIFFSSNAMMGIMRTFDRSYFEERSSRFLAKRWTAIKLTSLLIFFILVSVLLLATQGPIKTFFLKKLHWNTPLVRNIIMVLRWIIIVALNYFTIAVIYKLAPAVRNRWAIASPGAIIASLLTIITSWLFSEWVNHFGQFNKVYGSIGTVLILMNLVYINSLILIIGFEINVSITAAKADQALIETPNL